MKTEFEWQLDQSKQASFRRRLFVFVGIIIVVGLVFGIGYLWLESSIDSTQSDTTDVFVDVVVEEGMGTEEVAAALSVANIIGSTIPFKYYVWAEKLQGEFKPGLFAVSPGMTVPQLVSVLTDDRIGEVQVTILEGWDSEEIADAVSDAFGTTSFDVMLPSSRREQIRLDFLEATEQDYDYDFLVDRPEGASLEGYLFPDTYRFYRNAEMTEVVGKMLDNFGEKVDAARRQAIVDRGWTIYEVVTLASVVQKEAKVSEMSIVAGIFIARLKSGQRLESDATVNYITKADALQPTLDDTRIDSPYNTYRIYGLPVGPICNPGLVAIDAVIDPKISSYRYFLNTPEGDTLFSETYEEHLSKKREHLDGNN